MLKKLISIILVVFHLVTFSNIRDVFAFEAQGATLTLNVGSMTLGGGGISSTTTSLKAVNIGGLYPHSMSSASFSLRSGYTSSIGSVKPILISPIPNLSWQENSENNDVFDLDDYFSSPDGNVISFEVSGNSNIVINVDPFTHLVSFSQSQGWSGTESVVFTASSFGCETKSNEVSLTVEGIDNPPILDNIPDITANEGEEVLIIPVAVDLDGDEITYSFEAPFNEEGIWQTDYSDSGAYTITVTATDTTGLSDSQEVSVNVLNVNRPPVLEDISAIEENEGSVVVISPVATDADNDTLAYYYSQPFDSEGKWLTNYDDAGMYVVTVIASDGIDTVEKEVNITINNVNRPPELIISLSDYTVDANEYFYVTLFASDPDNDFMTFVLKKDGQEIQSGQIIDSYSKNISFFDVGDHTITAILTDAGGISTAVTKTVDVVDPSVNRDAIQPIMGDFNGDSLIDLGIHNADTGLWEVALSEQGAFTNSIDWLSDWAGTRDWLSLGGDFNGDGKTDIGGYNYKTGDLQVALSTGTSFTPGGTWLIFSDYSDSWSITTGNFNADRYVDIAFYHKDTGEVRVALGTGSDFSQPVTWMSDAGTDLRVLSGDFNGDSLADICLFNKTNGEFKVIFSNSDNFVDSSIWISGFSTNKDPFVSDFNGDGCSDVAYWDSSSGQWRHAISTGTGFADKGFWIESFGESTDELATVGDFDGNGQMDAAVFDQDDEGIDRWTIQISDKKPADLLIEVDSGTGGRIGLVYDYASQFENNQLPFPVYVLKSVTLVDTLPAGEPQEEYSQEFNYYGGYYDAQEREFRGFEKTRVTDPITGNYTETYFYQGKDDQNHALKAKVDKVLSFDSNGHQISRTVNTYSVRNAGSSENMLAFPALTEVNTTVWEENESSLSTSQSFIYDNIGNVVQSVLLGNSSVTGDEKTTKSAYAQAYEVGFNRPIEISFYDPSNNLVSKKIYSYDSKGNLASEGVLAINSIAGSSETISTNYSYDDFGNLISTVDALGHVTSTEYESTFHAYPKTVTNELGHSVNFIYDGRFGSVVSTTDTNGNVSEVSYDSLGRITESKNAYSEIVSHYEYPDFNTVITNKGGFIKTEYVDGLGRKYKIVSVGEDGENSRNILSEVYFNNRGAVDSESLTHYIDEDVSQISHVRYEYDVRGRLKKTISDFPGTLKDAESEVNYINPLYTETVDPMGHKNGTLKDVYGNVVKVTEFTSNGVFDTNYEYDILGNLVRLTDSQGNVTQIWYDSLGRKIKMDDPDMGIWTYEYDSLGNLVKQTDAKGQVVDFNYDGINRLTSKESNGLTLATYYYDDTNKDNCIGRLSKVEDQSGSTEFFYDKLGREIKSIKTVDSVPYTVERTYDILDRLSTLTYPDGAVVNYSYDSNSGLLEKVSGLSSVDYVKDITYNAQGQIKDIQYGNNVTTQYTYGQDLRLSRILTSNLTSTLQNLNYVFDKNGNITTLTDNLRSNVRTFTYDGLSRLLTAQNIPAQAGGFTNYNYQYDSIGNMTYKSDAGVMSYGENAGPHAMTTMGGYSYQYDANGNMIVGKNKTFQYDEENRIINIENNGVETSFVYDGDGGRVKKITPSGSTIYIGSLFEIDSAGKTTKHVYAGSNKVCSIEDTGSPETSHVYYTHSDHLGSSNIITDENGQQVQYLEYSPYGSVLVNQGGDVTPYKFTGKELDVSTGLYFYSARYYDPEIGRFVSPDTIVQSPFNPQTLNRYSYCNNNPINYIDPSGHSWFSKFFGKIFGVIAGVVGTIVTGNAMVGFQLYSMFDSLGTAVNTGNWGGFAGGLAGGILGGIAGVSWATSIAKSLGEASYTFGGGFMIGAAEFGSAGFGSSFGQSLGSGESFSEAIKQGAISFGIGSITGGLIEGCYLGGCQTFIHGMSVSHLVQVGVLPPPVASEVILASLNSTQGFSSTRTKTGNKRYGWNKYLHGTDKKGSVAISIERQLRSGSWVTLPEALDPSTGKIATALNPVQYQEFVGIPAPKGEFFADVVAPKKSVTFIQMSSGGAPEYRIDGMHIVTSVYANMNQ